MATMGVVFIGLLGLSKPAQAFTEGACKDDVKKLCPDVKPGGGAIKDCLNQHAGEVSQTCKDNMAEAKAKMKEKREELEAACKDDLKRYCSNVTPGEGREMACLRAYADKLSGGCKAKMPKPGMHHGSSLNKPNGYEDSTSSPPPQPPAAPPAAPAQH
jgi:hypothetical protein